MKISPPLVLFSSPPNVVKLSFDGKVVLTIVCGNGSKLESFPYRKKEIVIIIFVFRFFYRGIQVINGVIGGL